MSLAFTSFSFDQPEYNPGQTITLTVTYTSTDEAAGSSVVSAVTAALTDASTTTAVTQTSDGSASFPDFTVTTPANSAEPTTVAVSDNRSTPGTWALVSNNIAGNASPFTGTAVLTSTA